MEQNTLKHLELIHALVVRMAQNSFLLKVWAVTVTTAVLALAGASANPIFVAIALFPAISFWGLDAYYLWEERRYRALYDDVRLSSTNVNPPNAVEPFLLSTEKYKAQVTPWYKTWFSPRIFVFHAGVIAIICCVLSFFIWLSTQHI